MHAAPLLRGINALTQCACESSAHLTHSHTQALNAKPQALQNPSDGDHGAWSSGKKQTTPSHSLPKAAATPAQPRSSDGLHAIASKPRHTTSPMRWRGFAPWRSHGRPRLQHSHPLGRQLHSACSAGPIPQQQHFSSPQRHAQQLHRSMKHAQHSHTSTTCCHRKCAWCSTRTQRFRLHGAGSAGQVVCNSLQTATHQQGSLNSTRNVGAWQCICAARRAQLDS